MRVVTRLDSYVPRTVTVQNACKEAEMPESKEFNREGDAEVEDVVSKTGPLGLVPVMYIVVVILVIIGVVLWWAMR